MLIYGVSPRRRQVLKNGDEGEVVFTRHWCCWTQKPGACRRVKTRLNRRERRNEKIKLRKKLHTNDFLFGFWENFL